MVPEEWPIAAEAADPPVESARPRGRGRLDSVRRDFFLDPAERLTEQERALMTAMLHDLIGTMAEEIAAAEPSGATRIPDTADIARRLTAARLLDREELVALLLRRADEQRIAAAFAGRAGPRRLPLLPKLVGDSDSQVAAAAMAIVVARGRRRDAFGQPRVELSDLSGAEAAAIVQAVAAVLAATGEESETAMAIAGEAVLGRHDVAESLDSAVDALIVALEAAGRADEDLIDAAAAEGETALLAFLLARRAAIDPQVAWDHLINAGGGRLALLARMAGLSRQGAARLLAELGSMTGAAALEDEIACFDSLTADQVERAVAWWRLPAAYRAACTRLGTGNG